MKKIWEDIKKVFEGELWFRIILALGILVAALLIFAAGVSVGFRKASFGRDWGEHYGENFGLGAGRPGPLGLGGYFPTAHGAAGKVIKVELPNIIVEDKDGTEKAVKLADSTEIEQGSQDLRNTDVKLDQFVVVIGEPDASQNGVIDAKFVRIIPSPQFLK